MKITAERIAIMQAFLDGKKIEVKNKDAKFWEPSPEPAWNWQQYDYRVKEVRRTVYVALFDDWHEAVWFDSKKEAEDALSEGEAPKGVFPVVVNF